MTLEIYLAYIAACFLIAVVPGPTVTVIIGNSLAHGTRAGLLNVAGTQLGLGLMMAVLVVGLSSVIAAMGWLFDWLRWAGAAYLSGSARLLRSPEACRRRGGSAAGLPGHDANPRRCSGSAPSSRNSSTRRATTWRRSSRSA